MPNLRPFGAISVLALLICLTLGGCADSDLQSVSGRVSLNGEPIEKGAIRFVAADGAAPTAEAKIVDGHYETLVAPGAKQVTVEAYRLVGYGRDLGDGSPPPPLYEETVSPQRGQPGALTCEIQAGAAIHNFDVATP